MPIAPFLLNRDFPVDEHTTIKDLAMVTMKLLEQTQEMLHCTYGIAAKVPSLGGVHVRFVLLGDGRDGVRVTVPLLLDDGGELLKAEVARLQQLKQFSQRLAQSLKAEN